MDGKSTRKNAEDEFFSLYDEKGREIELTTRREEEPVQGAAS
jgi:hypothetical protein